MLCIHFSCFDTGDHFGWPVQLTAHAVCDVTPQHRWFKALILFNIKKFSKLGQKMHQHNELVWHKILLKPFFSATVTTPRTTSVLQTNTITMNRNPLAANIRHLTSLLYTLLVQISRTILTIHRQWIILLQNSSSYCSGKQQHCVTAPCFITQLNVILRK
jgi:hypothetical protein